jgi:uncharacterized repeat protein (TIGR01451 family)
MKRVRDEMSRVFARFERSVPSRAALMRLTSRDQNAPAGGLGVRLRGRYVLAGLLTALMLGAGASAHVLTLAGSSAIRAIGVVQHLTRDSVSQHHHSVYAASVIRATPADVQYVSPTVAPFAPPAGPTISIAIQPSTQTVSMGGTATFTITVTNTGTVVLSGVKVTDTISPSTTVTKNGTRSLASTATAGSLSAACGHTIGTLAENAKYTYKCTQKHVTVSFKTVAKATGTSPTSTMVSATATATAKVAAGPFEPPTSALIGIVMRPNKQKVHTTVDPSATASTLVFGTATFTITVKNRGTAKLTGVKVTDARSPLCDREVGALASGASSTYTCTHADVKTDFTNTAVASGFPPKGAKVHATASAAVAVAPTTGSASGAHFTG